MGDDTALLKENEKEQPDKETNKQIKKKNRKIWILRTSRDNGSKIRGFKILLISSVVEHLTAKYC